MRPLTRFTYRACAVYAVLTLVAASVLAWLSPHWLVPWAPSIRASLEVEPSERVQLRLAPQWTGQHLLDVEIRPPAAGAGATPVRLNWSIKYFDGRPELSGLDTIPEPEGTVARWGRVLAVGSNDPLPDLLATVEIVEAGDYLGGTALISVSPSSLEQQHRRSKCIRAARIVAAIALAGALTIAFMLVIAPRLMRRSSVE